MHGLSKLRACLGLKVYYRRGLEFVQIGLLTDREVKEGARNSLASVIHPPLRNPTHYLCYLFFQATCGNEPAGGVPAVVKKSCSGASEGAGSPPRVLEVPKEVERNFGACLD